MTLTAKEITTKTQFYCPHPDGKGRVYVLKVLKYIGRIFKRDSNPREYYVSYSVTVKNLSGGDNKVIIVLPVPPNSAYQIVNGEPAFTLGYHKSSDNKFGNEIVFWQGILQPEEEKYSAENLQIAVSPRKSVINPAWTIDNYSNIKDNQEYSLYLGDEAHVNGSDKKARGLAGSILNGERNLGVALDKLYRYVVDNLEYGNPVKGLYSYSYALEKRVVDCGGFDSLLGSLCRSAGIPSRIVSGFWAESEISEAYKKMHAWLEALLPNGDWFPLDPSVEHLRSRGRSRKEGGFGVTESDRIAFSYGSDITLKIGDKDLAQDILQNPVIVADGGVDSLEVKTVFVAQKM